MEASYRDRTSDHSKLAGYNTDQWSIIIQHARLKVSWFIIPYVLATGLEEALNYSTYRSVESRERKNSQNALHRRCAISMISRRRDISALWPEEPLLYTGSTVCFLGILTKWKLSFYSTRLIFLVNVDIHCLQLVVWQTALRSMPFSFLIAKPLLLYKYVWKQCSWVSKDPNRTCAKCNHEGIRGTCSLTCSGCTPPLTPSPGPGCQDFPLPFRFDQIKYICDIIRNSRQDLCLLGGYISSKQHSLSRCLLLLIVPTRIKRELWSFASRTSLKWKQCAAWVLLASDEEYCANRCAKNGFAETCPVSCSLCPSWLDEMTS